MNAIVVSPDGEWLIVNHGSRTEHGEVRDDGMAAPGLREIPLTSAIFRIPASATDVLLPNDEAALRASGYLFADGVRNMFDLAYDGAGRLYGVENSGDRDDADELNRLQEGNHYGFPWRMGSNDNPQQFPGYVPEADLLLNPLASSIQFGAFYDDPTYPPIPTGVTFTDPVVNVGPDADFYRDGSTGDIRRGHLTDQPTSTFTPHRSPLGLTFDVAGSLPAPFQDGGFTLAWTEGNPANPGASPLLTPFGDDSPDLLHLHFVHPDTVSATRIVAGFDGPMDAVLFDRTMYIVEIGASSGLWSVSFLDPNATHPAPGPVVSVRASPNPFRRATRIEIDMASSEAIRVDLIDALGRVIRPLHNGDLGQGQHAFDVEGEHLQQGSTWFEFRGG